MSIRSRIYLTRSLVLVMFSKPNAYGNTIIYGLVRDQEARNTSER